MPDPIDLTKTYKQFYAPSPKAPVIVEVPAFNYLMLDGTGNPNTSPEYQSVVEALFQFAYTLKFAIKKSTGPDYKVMPLQGLWWVEDMSKFSTSHKDDWLWTMMIAVAPSSSARFTTSRG